MTSCRAGSCGSSTSRSCRRRACSTKACAAAHWRPPLSSPVSDAVARDDVVTNPNCRSCGAELQVFLELGELPLPDALVSADALDGPEARYQLDVGFCPGC